MQVRILIALVDVVRRLADHQLLSGHRQFYVHLVDVAVPVLLVRLLHADAAGDEPWVESFQHGYPLPDALLRCFRTVEVVEPDLQSHLHTDLRHRYDRSEEHTPEPQSLMRNSYAVIR